MFENILLDTSISRIGIVIGFLTISMRVWGNTGAISLLKVCVYGILIMIFQGYINVYGDERMAMLNVFALIFCYVEFADNLGQFVKTIKEDGRK